jgi:hypothetical protein
MPYYKEKLTNFHMSKKIKRTSKISLIIRLKSMNKWNLISLNYSKISLIIEDKKINLKISKDKIPH